MSHAQTPIPSEQASDSTAFEQEYDRAAREFQPWVDPGPALKAEQRIIQSVLARKAGAKFGADCFVARGARVFTDSLELGDRSWIAAGAIVRGDVRLGADTSVNAYAHIAGRVTIGAGVRIAGGVAVYGFNHGFQRPDMPIFRQAVTAKGVTIEDDVWIGANAVILDGARIGAHCIIGAGAVVSGSFPAYQIIAGSPARVIRDRRSIVPAAATPTPAPANAPAGKRVRQLIFDSDPYADIERVFPEDLQGWGSDHPIFKEVIQELRPRLIVEVGSWKGASALGMAEICRGLGLETEIVCVDTWLGNWQHWARESGVGSRADLKMVNGFPMLYFQFLSNVRSKALESFITPLPLTSLAGAKLFKHHGLRPDLVYLDGDHEYESVIMDLRAWLAQVADSGMVIGDDYEWPGVKRAVAEVAAEGQWNPAVSGNKFTLRRAAAALRKAGTGEKVALAAGA
jgi:acetyltransferase-like isoleucine patch superfamily enzyme